MGEIRHNNHHQYTASARQGYFWWEVDLTFYVLRVLSWFRIVWDLREPPRHILLAAEPPPSPNAFHPQIGRDFVGNRTSDSWGL
jgi:hypothetical protein